MGNGIEGISCCIKLRWVTIQNIGMGELALCYWNGPPTPTEENDPSGWIFLKEVDELYSGKVCLKYVIVMKIGSITHHIFLRQP